MNNGTSLLAFLRSIHAVFVVPFPAFDEGTLQAMGSIYLIEPFGDQEYGLLHSPSPPCRSWHTPTSLFYALSKPVWEALRATIDGSILALIFSGKIDLFHRVSGNRLLRLCSSPTVPSVPSQKPTRSPHMVTKLECMYRCNWNRKYPLGVSNPVHMQSVGSPEDFARMVMGTASVPSQLVDTIWTIRQKCNSINFEEWLGKLAPLPSQWESIKSNMLPMDALRTVSVVPTLTSSPADVCVAVSRALESVLPSHLWRSDWRRAIQQYISLSRFETFDTDRIKVNINGKLKNFIFTKIVIPIISYFFYVTDCDLGDTRVVYIRRPVWDVLVSRASVALVELLQLKPVPTESSIMGASVRWLPKKTGLRPVVRQPKTVKDRTKKLLRYLTALRVEDQRIGGVKLGVSAFTREKCFDVFSRFVQKGTSSGPLRFFTADIQNCFESIPFQPLHESLRQMAVDNCLFSSVMVGVSRLGSAGPVRKRPVVFLRENVDNLLAQLPSSSDPQRPVVIQADCTSLSDERMSFAAVREEIMKIVKSAVYKLNTVGSTTSVESFKVTGRGLPQGSSFSVMLVSIFYGWLDQRIRPLLTSSTAVVRLVDDLICLSRDEVQFNTFLQQVVTHRLYGNINESKLHVGSIPASGGTDIMMGGHQTPVEVHWAGFRLRPDGHGKLNVGVQPAGTLALTASASTGELVQFFDASLGKSIAQNCLPLLFDRTINSAQCVHENAYRAGCMAGRKVAGWLAQAKSFSDTTVDRFVKKLNRFVLRRLRGDKQLLRQFGLGFEHALGGGRERVRDS